MITLRPYASADEEPFVALWNRVLWADPISPAFFRERLLLDPNVEGEDLIAAEDDGRLLGAAVAFVRRTDLPWGCEGRKERSKGTGYLLPVVFDPALRTQGTGDALIAAAEAHLRSLGASAVSVCEYTPLFFPDGVDGKRYPEVHRCFLDHGYQAAGVTYRMGCDLRERPVPDKTLRLEERLQGENIVFTAFQPRHLLAVRRFLLSEFPGWMPPFAHKVATRAPANEVILALEGENVVGYCQYNYYGQAERAGPFGVSEHLRGKDVGEVMVAHLLRAMSEAGYKFAYFDSTGARQTRFFAKNGFAVFSEKTLFRKTLESGPTRRRFLKGLAAAGGVLAFDGPKSRALEGLFQGGSAQPPAVRALSLEEKVGQLFLLAFEGSRPANAETMLTKYLVGGVYLSQDNLTSVEQAVRLIADLQRMGAGTPHALPIFAACDQEGAWSLLKPQATAGPGNLALGAASPAGAGRMYEVFGRELRALGIAGDLAPVSDVNSNPRNPIIGSRSFGQDPQRVAAHVEAAIRGLHRGGTRACAKHFPGHGDTSQDSHRGLATVLRTKEQIFAGDLVPFRTAVETGVDIVMTAHLIYPAFDPEWPATLSPAILQGVLRKELGFKGVILTDSFSMGAIQRNYGTAAAAIRAINAGADLIMLAEERYGIEPKDYLARQIALVEAVLAAARDGRIPTARLDEAVGRILTLKAAAGLFRRPYPDMGEALREVGCTENRAVALECARQAIVVARNRDGRVPLSIDARSQLLLVSPVRPDAYDIMPRMRGIGPNIDEPPTPVLYREIVRRSPSAQMLRISDPGEIGAHLAQLRSATAVLVATENYPLPGFDFPTDNQRRVIEALVEAGISPVVIGLRDPYELLDLPSVRTYVAALGYAPVCARAAAEVLFGERPPLGRMPVAVE